MIIRAGFFIVAIVSALKIRQINANSSRKPSTSENEKASSQQEEVEEKNGKFEESKIKPSEKEVKKIKTCRSLSAEEQHHVRNKHGCGEIDLLNFVVKEKQKESANLDLRFLELYCLKEQQSRVALLQNELIHKISEIDRLRWKIDELKADNGKFHEELKLNELVKKQVESANATILELQAKRELGTKQIEGHFVQLKEQFSGIRAQEEHKGYTYKVEKKLKALKDVEMKANKMKRKSIELQLDKRELVVKLKSAKAKMSELSCLTEQKVVAKLQEEISILKHKKDDLVEEIDRLQRDRFSSLEELVYQRWLNTCLRFEVEDHRSPGPKKIKPTENHKLNLWSSSNSSEISSIDSSDELTWNSTISSSSSIYVKEKKASILHTIKRWTRSKDNKSNTNASDTKSNQGKPGRIRRFSTSSIPNSLLGLRSRGGDNGKIDYNSPEKPATPRVRRVSFNDSINSIRYIYEETPKSDQETSDSSQETNPESFSDFSAMETYSGTDAALVNMEVEFPSAKPKGDDDTMLEEKKAEMENPWELKHQDLGTEIGQLEETMNSGMKPDDEEASGVSRFCDLLVNLTAGLLLLILFLVLISYRFVSAF